MAATEKRTFSLPHEQAKYIDALVKSGGYATGSEVIRAGIRALQERDVALERWLREEVVPVALAMKTEPCRGLSPEEVLTDLRALHRQRTKSRNREV